MDRPARLRLSLARARVAALAAILAVVGAACDSGGPSAEAGAAATRTAATADATTSTTAAATEAELRCGGVAVGLLAPFSATDEDRALATELERGVHLAVADFQRAHPGCLVEVVPVDTGPGSAGASAAGKAVRHEGRVLAVIGPSRADDTGAMAPLAEAGVPVVSASATDADMGGRWDTFHRVVRPEGGEGAALARYVQEDLAARTVAVLDDGADASADVTAELTAELEGGGVRLVPVDPITPEMPDLGGTVADLRADPADVVVYVGAPALGGRLVKQLHDGGVTARVVGLGLFDPAFLDHAGGAAQDVLVVSDAAPVTQLASAADFVTAYRLAHFPASPGPFAAEAYDAAGVLLDAVAAGAVTRAQVEEHLDAVSYQGITGTIRFGEDGEGSAGLYLARVDGGAFVSAGRLR